MTSETPTDNEKPVVVLVVDDDPLVPIIVHRALDGVPHRIDSALDGASGLSKARAHPPDLIILDNVLPDGLGLESLPMLHRLSPDTPILFVTARGSGGAAIEAMKNCAFDYLPKPLDPQKLRSQITRALSLRKARQELDEQADAAPSQGANATTAQPADLVGDCPAMQSVFKAIGKVALQDISVLISGEHGSGKQSVAKAIHHNSENAAGPLVSLSCSGLSEERLEEEIFGREPTGGQGACGGLREASGGTLVLQEVGEVPLPLQTKLLTALRDRRYTTIDGHEAPVECRLVAITTEDLEAKSRARQFRSDLYYTLSSFVINLPPVRQRHGDLPLLVEQIIKKLLPIARRFGVENPYVSPDAMKALESHLWPGNIDELESVLKRSLIEQKGNILLASDLITAVSGGSAVPASPGPGASRYSTDWSAFAELRLDSNGDTLHADAIEEMERKLFERVLRHTRGNQAQASRRLGITRASLRKKLRLYGMTAKPTDE